MKKYLPVFLTFIFAILISINLRAADSKSGDSKVNAAKPVDSRSSDVKVSDNSKAADTKSSVSKTTESKADDSKGSEAKSNEVPPEALGDDDTPTPLNKEVRYEGEDQINKILRNMVVVQRKAKNKAGHFLFNPSMGLDFSDGPTTFYTFNANLGYAVSDFWEFYVNYVPKFMVQERGIVKKVSSLNVVDKRCNPQNASFCTPQSAQIFYERPMSQLGVEIVFAPSYGKESWGTNTMFRSDTFFKLGLSQIKFETGHNGMRYAFMLGKTFFVAKYFNTRMDAGIHYMQTFVDNDTKFSPLLFVEAGLVFYF